MDSHNWHMSLLDSLANDLPATAHEIASNYVSRVRGLAKNPVLKLATNEEGQSIRLRAIPRSSARLLPEVLSEANEIYSYRMQMDHPSVFGFIPSPTTPVSFLGDMLTSAFNPFARSWLQSSGPSAVEVALIQWLAEMARLRKETSGGIFVSGGSMANLIGLTVARDQMLGEEWENKAKGIAYISGQTHSSISKGLRILGFSDKQIRKLKTDDSFRMDVEAVKLAIDEDREKGLIPFLIVASCGTTNTGSVDPLLELATLARSQNPRLWLHVDGVYGASVSLSNKYKHLIKGLGEADSISWDAHKWLFQTYGCGMALVRDRRWLMQSFITGAEYTRDAADSGDYESPNYWNFGPEMTRPARAMKLWFTLQVLGLDVFGSMIDHGIDVAEVAEKELQKLPDWTIVSGASMAIVNFRYQPLGRSEEEVDQLNETISRKLLLDNVAAALTTKLLGRTVIRICSISPNLSVEAMQEIIGELDKAALLLS